MLTFTLLKGKIFQWLRTIIFFMVFRRLRSAFSPQTQYTDYTLYTAVTTNGIVLLDVKRLKDAGEHPITQIRKEENNMRKYLILIAAVVLIAVLTGSPVFAAAQAGQSSKPGQITQPLGQKPTEAQAGQQGPLTNAFLANELMDKKVISMRQNEPLGTVQNMVIDPNGFVAYILLEPAPGMKETGQLIAIPWDVAHPTIHNNQVELFLSKQQVQNAPTISKNNLAQLQNPEWQQKNFAYFGMGYMPPQGYEVPQEGMTPPQGYGMPPQGYGMPPQGYGAGSDEGYNY